MNIILFGAGKMTMRFLESEESHGHNILAVADNDTARQGTKLTAGNKSLEIISAEEVAAYQFDIVLITIANFSHQLDIANKLMSLGVNFDKIKLLHNMHIVNCIKVLDKAYSLVKDDAILIDVSDAAHCFFVTGIQRTIIELYKNLLAIGASVCLVQFIGGKWITANEFDCRINNKVFDGVEYVVRTDGRKLLLPDALWNNERVLDEISGGRELSVIVYDIIPILHPECVVDAYQQKFVRWLDNVLKYASQCICISKSVADDLIAYYKHKNIKRENSLEIHYMHLGFDIPKLEESVRKNIADFVNRGMTFLIVGTVEIRKNHHLLLRSFKRVCQELPDKQIQLLIVGKDGWKNEDFKKMYDSDKLIHERCLWVKDASDGEVQWAYNHCVALVYPTRAEGFGLPLVEAAHFGLPILCSDIPIFHEVVGDNADYFAVNDEYALQEALIKWIQSELHPDSRFVKTYTWKECATELLDTMNGNVDSYDVLF